MKPSQLDIELTNYSAITFILNRFDKIRVNHKKIPEVWAWSVISIAIWFEGDTDKMTQVIDNLLNNAIKYTHPMVGKIKVGMKTTDAQLIISALRWGLRNSKKDLPRILIVFLMDKAHATGPKAELGLGLAMLRILSSWGFYLGKWIW